jgi:predicted dehydrogenase
MKETRIGVIGLGGMARWHMEQLGKIEGVRIIALCDVDAQALEVTGDRLSVPQDKRYDRIASLIRDPDVDGIVSVTPNDSHALILKACIEADKPLFAEKPLTRTFEEAEEVLQEYRRKPIPLLINFSYRILPAFQYARKMLREGRLGRVNHLFVQYMQDWGSTVKKTPYLWRFDEEVTGTGTLGDLGSHMLDIAEYLTGMRISELQAMLQTIVPERTLPGTGEIRAVLVDDFACFNARFSEGAIGVFQTSRNALGCGNQHEVALYGEAGTLRISTLNDREVLWTYVQEGTSDTVTEAIEIEESLRMNPWQEFVDRVRGDREPNTEFASLEDGYRNQQLLEAVVKAHNSRTIVTVN